MNQTDELNRSMNQDIRILYLEDEPNDAVIVHHQLRKDGLKCRTQRVDTREAFLAALEQEPPDIILSDHNLPAFDGFSALALAKDRCPQTPFVFVTDSLGEEMTIETFAKGATDCVPKKNLSLLAPAIRGALDASRNGGPLPQKPRQWPGDETRTEIVLQTAPEAIVFMDEQGVVEEWNPAAERTFGYSRAIALGFKLAELIFPPAAREAQVRVLQRYLAADESHRIGRWIADKDHWMGQWIEMAALRADGTEFPMELAVVRAPGCGTPRFIGHLRDITERRQAGQEWRRLKAALERVSTRRSALLEEASRELKMFSQVVSRDVAARLRRILSLGELLQGESTWRLDRNARRRLETIAGLARHGLTLLDALLAYSSLGQPGLRWQAVKLAALVKNARRRLGPIISGRKIDWRIGKLPEVQGDPALLGQAVFQLLSNAVKFTSPRQQAWIAVEADATEAGTVVAVRDNGVGFDMRNAHKLFEVFQRFHSAESFEGVGLGLASVRRIIERHGGRTWADGAINEGATFYFSLPPGARPDGEGENVW